MDVMDLNAGFPVCVRCMTYNQSAYITDALNGFCMQKTAFPYYVVVFDDASTDGEQKVIKTYLDENFNCSEAHGYKQWEREEAFYVFAQHLENTNCHFLVVYLKKNLYKTARKDDLINEWCKAKYIALCEGDDYWTDPLKLQKQVDFMEEHEEYSMCFHEVKVLCDDKENWIFSDVKEGDHSARDIYEKWTVPTCSVLYRKGKPFERSPKIIYGDIFLYLQLAERGKIRCLGFVGGVYRRHKGSISCGYSLQSCIRLYHQYKFMEKRFPEVKDISRREQEEQGLLGIIGAPYFKGIWKYRFYYMFRHPRLFFSSFFTTTLLSCTYVGRLLTKKPL